MSQTLPSETSEADDSNQLLKSPPSASPFSLHFSVCLSHIMSQWVTVEEEITENKHLKQ